MTERRRRSNRNHQGNQHPLSSRGPLLTNHLQGQYEHQQTTPNFQPFNYSQHDRSSHFGHNRPLGVERQAIDPWQMGVFQLDQSPTHKDTILQNVTSLKMIKFRPKRTPNKPASYPVEKTNELVTEAMTDPEPDEIQVLRADRNPTVQVKGRLELALGIIMKEIKQEHCSEPDDLKYFLSNFVQRLLKHTIRTRIRNVMMGRYVGAPSDIVEAYRLKYPKETDIELIKVAKDAQCLNGPQPGSIRLIDADDPEEFFRKNMTKILMIKLDDMFHKLEEVYANTGGNLEDYIEKLPEPNGKKDNEKKQKPKVLSVEDICDEDGSLTKISENVAKVKFYTKLMEELIEDCLPKIIPKFKNILLSTVFCEKEFLGIKAMITAESKRKILKTIQKDETYLIHNKKVGSDDKSEEKANEKSSLNVKENEKTPGDTNFSIDITEDEPKTKDNGTTKEAKQNDSEVNITSVIETIEIDKPASVGAPVQMSPNRSAPTLSAQTPQTQFAEDMLYVKLIGLPVLPARAVIHDFLKKFNPASIKKHKFISNLLVLELSDRENFDKILLANESIVGESTIIIKASEQVTGKKQIRNPSKTFNTTNPLNKTKLQESSEPMDLDSQITDLVITIKKCEEDIGIVAPEALEEANNESKPDNNIEI